MKAVQVSLDGASRPTFNRMRVLGEFDTVVEGTKNLRAAGVPIEINFSPTRFNIGEIGAAVDLAHELGAYSFYTGRTMYTGNAVKTWRIVAPSEEQYVEFFSSCTRRPTSIGAACAFTFTRWDCSRSCAIACSILQRC